MIYIIVLTVIIVLYCVDSRKNNVPLFSPWGEVSIFLSGGGELGGLNVNVAFRMRKEGGYSCLYLIHLGWIAQSWVKITQDNIKLGFRYGT